MLDVLPVLSEEIQIKSYQKDVYPKLVFYFYNFGSNPVGPLSTYNIPVVKRVFREEVAVPAGVAADGRHEGAQLGGV